MSEISIVIHLSSTYQYYQTASLLTDLYSYETEFIQKLVKDKRNREAKAFNLTMMFCKSIIQTLLNGFH